MATGILKQVLYVHHTRLADGDTVFFFRDPAIDKGADVLQSSAVRKLRRHGTSFGNWYVISTENSDYLVQMQPGTAHHLALEIGVPLV